MHSISEHRDPPYIEITVYGRYPENYRSDFETVIIRYADQYDSFCFLEVQHGKLSNGLWRLLQSGGKVSEAMLSALKRLKRVAIVGDEPGILLKLIAASPQLGSTKLKLFKLHELDTARSWMRL